MTHAIPVTYALQFRGQVDDRRAHLGFDARIQHDARLGRRPRRAAGRFEDVGSGEAVFRVTLDGDGPVEGRVDFGGGTTLCLRAAERHAAEPTRRPHLHHGAALLEVIAGTGRLEGTRAWVTSNFLLSDTGDLTDTHLGLLFLERP